MSNISLTSSYCGSTIAIGARNSTQAVAAPVSIADALPFVYSASRSAAGVQRIEDPRGEEVGPVLNRLRAPATSAEPPTVTDHFIDKHINFRRLFAEAVQDTIVDQFPRDKIEPGYFLVRSHRKTRPGEFLPMMPARIYWRDHEPGNPENKLDRWPNQVLAGELIGEDVDPVLIWTGRDRQPLTPPAGYTLEGWYAYLVAHAKWASAHAPEEPIARPRQPSRLTSLPPIGPPPGSVGKDK